MSLDSVTEYALSFSEDAVHLQRRERGADSAAALAAWRHLGSVDFDSATFRDDLVLLRAMASGDAGGDQDDAALPVTLVIPDDQILYTTLTVAPGADRERAVGKALDGLTPYTIDELAFDWQGDGDSVRVAAVARQTLREAREFAAQYGFDGQEYCALPQGDVYPGEPVFQLQPPSRMAMRPRPSVDLHHAGVTAPALMIEEDGPGNAPDPDQGLDEGADGDARDDLDLGGDVGDLGDVTEGPEAVTPAPADLPEAGNETGNETPDASGDDTVAAAAPEAAAIATASEGAARGGADAPDRAFAHDATGADAGPSPQPVSQTMAQAEPAGADLSQSELSQSDAPVPDSAAPQAAQDDPATDRTGGDPSKGADDSADAVAAIAPVVRHVPAGGQTPPPGLALNPRARAVHERAAGARAARAAGAAPAPAARPGERGGLLGLVAMLGALVVGLILIWAFAVPDPEGAQSVAQDSAPEQTALPAQSEPATQTVAQTATPDRAQQPMPQNAAAPENVAAPESPAAPQTGVDDAQALPPTAEQGAATLAPVPAAASALTDEEQRRVIVAAAAVAAAVVPPLSSQTDEARAPAQPLSAQTAAAAPAATAALAPTRPAPTRSDATPAAAGSTRPASPPDAQQTPSAAATAPRLTSSSRPQLAPRRSTPQTTTPRADAAPSVPTNPLPFSTAAPEPIRASTRPPARSRAATPVPAQSAPAQTAPAQTAPAQTAPTQTAPAQTAPTQTTTNAAADLRGSARPPARPEGSVPDMPTGATGPEAEALSDAEQDHLRALIRDLGRGALARSGPSQGVAPADAQSVLQSVLSGPRDMRLAQARPMRKPGSDTASDAVSSSAVEAALRSATTPPPDRPARDAAAAAAPARDSGGLLRGSARPNRRPGNGGGAAGLSGDAVEAAISAAVSASPATPGGVQLSALAASPLPPRRSDAAERPATSPDAPASDGPSGAPAAAAAPAAANDAEQAARRALDEQLQAQAEARIRARAQADAAAEAQARAQAEARARAQAEAEERAARARQQEYKPPEIDNEPEIAAAEAGRGGSSASVAKAATQSNAMNTGRTTIIGIIGAGKASRALIRLRNGKVVTVRLGDRIDGGTINSIGDGRLTYVKSGRTHELRMLDGR